MIKIICTDKHNFMVSYFVSTFLTLAKICQSLTLMKKFHFSFLVQISHHVTVSLKHLNVQVPCHFIGQKFEGFGGSDGKI